MHDPNDNWTVGARKPRSGESVWLQRLVSMGGNVHWILLQNEPIFTKRQENAHNEGKQIWNFNYLIIFPELAGGILEPIYQYYAH